MDFLRFASLAALTVGAVGCFSGPPQVGVLLGANTDGLDTQGSGTHLTTGVSATGTLPTSPTEPVFGTTGGSSDDGSDESDVTTSPESSGDEVGPGTDDDSGSSTTMPPPTTTTSVGTSMGDSSSTTGVGDESSTGGATWTCSPSFYDADDGCDCGCGIVDPDCADMTAASCDYCAQLGSCGEPGGCPGTIDPENNALCTE